MKLCIVCENEVKNNEEQCPSCGAFVNIESQLVFETTNKKCSLSQFWLNRNKKQNNIEKTNAKVFQNEDIEENKFVAALSYLGFFVLVPLFLATNSNYARFHAKQGVNLSVVAILHVIVSYMLHFIKITKTTFISGKAYIYTQTPDAITVILALMCIPIFVLAIIGVINAVNGNARLLPLIGKLKILKN